MNAILTLNIDDFLSDNARKSMLHAAKRWDCEFIEIKERLIKNQDVCFNKLVAINNIKNRFNSIFYIDADCLIRSDCPNPFQLFNKNFIYAVRDGRDDWTKNRIKLFRTDVVERWLKEVHNNLKYDIDIENALLNCHKWFFNAGVFMVNNPVDINEIEIFINNIPTNAVSERIEQAIGRTEQVMWNYLLKDKVEFMPYEWNLIDPDVSSGRMNGYIYHFTGLNHIFLKPLVKTYEWDIG